MGASIIYVLPFLVFYISIVSTTVWALYNTDHELITGGGATYNVINYGAVGDAQTDDSNAFLKAWNDACGGSGGQQVFLVPQGKTFLLKPIAFSGPCKSTVRFMVSGDLVAPRTRQGWTNCNENTWIYFKDVQGLQFTGSGKINGQGQIWWQGTISQIGGCDRPTGIRFHNCNGLQLEGTTHINSPKNHIEVEMSQNVQISRLNIIAPQNSPNTDGIDISSSSNVNIQNCFIGTGDDCIAIKGSSSFINITSITCGPGHGISVGGLGEFGKNQVVEHVFVRGCTLNGTLYGARIKTFQGGSGSVSSVTYQDITLVNSGYPIIIDQFYCDGKKTCGTSPQAVRVSGVEFQGFQGTSAKKEAISLRCSDTVPCTNLKFANIRITSSNPGQGLTSLCQNAHGTTIPPVKPDIPCLQK